MSPATRPVHSSGLELEGVSVVRAEKVILDNLTASCLVGEVTAITGSTGAGKSTLVHLLAALIRPTQGIVRAEGEPISRWVSSHRDRWRRQVGLALQSPHLFPRLTALENVIIPAVPRGGRCGRSGLGELRHEASKALERLGAGALVARSIETCSGGEQQRIALARATLGSPRYLLLDEPTAHQDEEGLALVITTIKEARERGATVVVATHDPRLEEWGVFDATLRLDEGRLIGVSEEEV